MGVLPTAPAYQVALLWEQIRALSEAVRVLQDALNNETHERAQVTAYSGGTQCTVTYPSGAPRTLAYLSPYVPVVNDQVLIVNSPSWSGVVGKVSV